MDGTGHDPEWLAMARELQAMAETGLCFASDPYDRQRYQRMGDIATELMARGLGAPLRAVEAILRFNTGYATPKMGVRGAVFREGRVLLVREKADGLWSLPGGWCEINQPPAACIEREIQEESGLTARAVKLAALYDHRLHHPPHIYHHYVAYFICEPTGGALAASDETDAARFFAEDELPAFSTSRVQAFQVKEMFRHWRDPGLTAYFDRS